MADDSTEIADLLHRAGDGESEAISDLFSRFRGRLKRMVRLRLNRRLYGRVDDSDVLQEAYLEAARRLPEYLQEPVLPFFLWLRHITGQQLLVVHRRHLGTRMRDAAREVSLHRGGLPAASSASLAAQLLGRLTSPSQAAVKAERRLRLQEALNTMDEFDREVLTLRHFEQLSNSEVATTLGIQESAASKRYVRALDRLQQTLSELGLFNER
ncbi:MAG: sigma-70 family RNA polymerase sigma factor [Planctomycetaceae bacterium]